MEREERPNHFDSPFPQLIFTREEMNYEWILRDTEEMIICCLAECRLDMATILGRMLIDENYKFDEDRIAEAVVTGYHKAIQIYINELVNNVMCATCSQEADTCVVCREVVGSSVYSVIRSYIERMTNAGQEVPFASIENQRLLQHHKGELALKNINRNLSQESSFLNADMFSRAIIDMVLTRKPIDIK